MSPRSLASLLSLVVLIALAALAASGVTPVHGASFTVNATHDAVDAAPGDGVCADAGGACTLRAAVIETNALPGADEISLPAGRFVLSIPGAGEEASATGDLDITDGLLLSGVGLDTSVIDGGGLDRVIHVKPPGQLPVTFVAQLLTVRNGTAISGGGVLNDFGGDLGLANVAVRGNIANAPTGFGTGGGIANLAAAELSGVHVTNNSTNFSGGGIYNGLTFQTRLTISDSVIATNSAEWHGGGIFNSDALVIAGSVIVDNTAGHDGGGIAMYGGRLDLEANLIAGNSALDGGGIFTNGTVSAVNVTISGNAATQGSGIFNDQQPGNLDMTNLTIAANTGSGVAIRNTSIATAVNTIVSNPNSASNCAGNIGSNGHNLDSDGTCGLAGPGDLSNVDPLLEPLADNGGPTQTHLIPGGSPAIDAGDNVGCPTIDQRGFSRPWDADGDGVARCDIGAVESQLISEPPPVPCPAGQSCPPCPAGVAGCALLPTPTPVSPITLPPTGGDTGPPNPLSLVVMALALPALAVATFIGRRLLRRVFTHR